MMLRSGDLWRDLEFFAILAMGFLTKGFGKLINCLEWTYHKRWELPN